MTMLRLALGVSLVASPLAAAPFDGTQPIICAATEILECERNLQCEAQNADTVDLPLFLRFSVADKTVTGTRPSGEPVNAKIELVRHDEEQMFLQGVQKRFGWSVAIDQAKGFMTLTIHDQASGFVVFGACTLR